MWETITGIFMYSKYSRAVVRYKLLMLRHMYLAFSMLTILFQGNFAVSRSAVQMEALPL
jgi:hypothetical protein